MFYKSIPKTIPGGDKKTFVALITEFSGIILPRGKIWHRKSKSMFKGM